MALADQLNQAKNNALQTTTVNTNALQSMGNNIANIGTSLASNLGTKLTSNTPTIYASGNDLANARNTYGNAYNYQNLATNPNANLKQGDIVAGGSAVTPGISDSAINNAGAQRLYGNTSADTLSAMQNNSKSALPQYYQNNNNAALANTNYQNLSPNIDVSGYKSQIGDALSNASNYSYVKSNNVGMDNTPYTNAINSATNNANSQATTYQSAIQKALDAYNGTSTASGTPSAQDIYNNSKTNAEYLSNMQKYYPQQYQQILQLRQQAQDAVANNQDTSGLKQQYQGVLNSGQGQTTSSATNTTDTPQSNEDYVKGMTDRINSLYDTQSNNVAAQYQTGLQQEAQQMDSYRNQASVSDQQNLNKLKEAMAQQGLFNSGDNITSQTGINNEYAGNLAGYNQQQQNYVDNVNNQITQQKNQIAAAKAQAMMDMYNNADSRAFKLSNLNNDQKQQAFQNAITGINAQYGMGQDQFGNTLKGTSATYGMGRDNVSDQEYNNDSQMKADQINYSRDQDKFNNTLKAVAQQYGMDEDQVQNLLNYAKFNSSEDQRQYENSTGTNQNNYNIYNNGVKNDQSQQQITNQNNQWNQNYNTQKDEWQKTFDNSNSQWQQEFDYKKQQDAITNALAQSRAASGSSGRSGGRSSSGGSSKKSSSGYDDSTAGSYAKDAAALKAMGYNSSFINASMPTWNYVDSPYTIYSGGR